MSTVKTYNWEEVNKIINFDNDVMLYLNELYFSWGKEIKFTLGILSTKLFPETKIDDPISYFNNLKENKIKRKNAYDAACEKIRNKQNLPPVIIDHDAHTNKLKLVDGHHRLAAAWSEKLMHVPAFFIASL